MSQLVLRMVWEVLYDAPPEEHEKLKENLRGVAETAADDAHLTGSLEATMTAQRIDVQPVDEAEYTSIFPDECPGVLKLRGWVFMAEGRAKAVAEVGWAAPEDYCDADDARSGFSKDYASHFDVYFRDGHGHLNACADDSQAEDFA